MLVSRSASGSLSTSVYRKPTFSGLYLKWDSFVPKNFKTGLVYGLIHRAWKICSDYHNFHKELVFMENTLKCNGYPSTFIKKCIKNYLSKLHQEPESTCEPEPEKRTVTLRLPFSGINSAKTKRQITRLVKSLVPSIHVNFIFVPVCKLFKLSKLKCQIPTLSRSSVVYKVECSECNEFYVGMTTRRLQQRLKEHSQSDSSALRRHALDANHDIDFANASIMATDQYRSRLYVKESLCIKDVSAYLSLNGNIGSMELKLW